MHPNDAFPNYKNVISNFSGRIPLTDLAISTYGLKFGCRSKFNNVVPSGQLSNAVQDLNRS